MFDLKSVEQLLKWKIETAYDRNKFEYEEALKLYNLRLNAVNLDLTEDDDGDASPYPSISSPSPRRKSTSKAEV